VPFKYKKGATIMKIHQVIFAENIQPNPPVATHILPGYILLPYAPEEKRPIYYSLALAISIVGEDNENLSVPIAIEIFDPKGNRIGNGNSSSQQSAPVRNGNIDGYVSAFVNMDLRNFPFTMTGAYVFKIRVGNLKHEEVLRVTVDDSHE
jgi:hypothetical protein